MSDNVIEISGLTRKFGKIIAVDNLSLSVPRGSIYGFLGPNGAGKTTTIRMLLGLIRPDEGHVRLFSYLFDKNRIEILSQVGALVETPSFYPHLTGYENLEITKILIGARLEQVFEPWR